MPRKKSVVRAADQWSWPPIFYVAATSLLMADILVVGGGKAGAVGEAFAQNADATGACKAMDLQATIDGFERELGEVVGRFIVRVGAPQNDIADADARQAEDVSAAMLDAGALMAEPVAGPLIVMEVSGTKLRQVADDPRIVCIERDIPDAPGQ
ncbi:MAG: hypothetical protein AAFY56_09590 [Pseudomonadota bacterium]